VAPNFVTNKPNINFDALKKLFPGTLPAEKIANNRQVQVKNLASKTKRSELLVLFKGLEGYGQLTFVKKSGEAIVQFKTEEMA